MHLVPADRADHPVIDDHRVCEAIAALGDQGDVAAWASRFSLLGDPGRLSLLLCIWRAGPISVTDLALATGIQDTTVSQALRLLRTAGIVTAQRDGRIVRYAIADQTILPVLALARPAVRSATAPR
jgi:DNA-binding transcriptional ArsR family regulator